MWNRLGQNFRSYRKKGVSGFEIHCMLCVCISAKYEMCAFDRAWLIFQIDQMILSLPSREYFLNDRYRKERDAYRTFMTEVAVLMGADPLYAQEEMGRVLQFEIALSNVSAHLPSLWSMLRSVLQWSTPIDQQLMGRELITGPPRDSEWLRGSARRAADWSDRRRPQL